MGVNSEILIKIPKEGKHCTGKSLEGIVKYHLDKETTYRKISLSLVGKAYCSWKQYDHGHRPLNARYRQQVKVGGFYKCEGHETIVVMKIDLLNKNIDENVTLNAGSYEQPFEMEIPENIPPTVKTDIGEIKYNLVLKFKKPSLFSMSKMFKTRLEIYPSVDPSIPDEPVMFALDKTLTKLFSSKKNEINLKAELDKAYLTPYSEKKISFTVTNNSDVIIAVKTELISKTKYKDDYSFEKTVEEVIDYCTVETPSIPDNSIANMFNIIPVPMEQHTIRHSKIMSREYKLKVTLKLPLPHINESIKVPVFVGEKFNEVTDEAVGGESSEARGEPPPYWEVMAEDKCKD